MSQKKLCRVTCGWIHNFGPITSADQAGMAPQTPGALRWTCNEWEMYSYSFPRPDTTYHTAQGSRLHVSCTLSQGVPLGHPCKGPVARKGFPRMFGENGKHARLHARSDARPKCRVDRFAGQRSRAARQRSSRRRLRSRWGHGHDARPCPHPIRTVVRSRSRPWEVHPQNVASGHRDGEKVRLTPPLSSAVYVITC